MLAGSVQQRSVQQRSVQQPWPDAALPGMAVRRLQPGAPLEHRAIPAADQPVAQQGSLQTAPIIRAEGQQICRPAQQTGEQNGGTGVPFPRRRRLPPGPPQMLEQPGRIPASGKTQVEGAPTGNTKNADDSGSRHGGETMAPDQCHHASQGPSHQPWPPPSTMSQPPQRPAWLNWVILLAFLWSSWQLAGIWLARFHGS